MDESRAQLALAYARSRVRGAFSALIQLDTALSHSAAAVSDPFYGQVRMAWWRDQIAVLGTGTVVNDPVLMSLERIISPVRTDAIRLVNAWETVFDPWPMTVESADEHARERGEALFAMAAALAGEPFGTDLSTAGRLWAMADVALHCPDRKVAERMIEAARPLVGIAEHVPRSMLAFAILARFAERDVQRGLSNKIKPGSPRLITEAVGLFLGLG